MKDGKISVLHLRGSNFFGGPEKQIVNHALHVDATRFLVTIATYAENRPSNELADRVRSLGLPLELINDPGGSRLTTVINTLRAIDAVSADILCCHDPKSVLIGELLGRIRKIPVIVFSRGWTHENQKVRLYEGIERFMLRFVDHVVSVSHGQKEKLTALGLDSGGISVIYNAVELKEQSKSVNIRKEYGIPHDANIVASAGRLSPEKNYAGMIKAASLLTAKSTNTFFLIFGEGALREDLEKRIKAANLCNRFFLPGFRTDLADTLHEIDVFMLTSFTEGLPNVVLEAFAAKKPVIATAVGGTPEVVQDGISGFLMSPDQHEIMAECIFTLSKDRNLCERMGCAGHEHVKKYFTVEGQTSQLEELYDAFYNRCHARS